ncbi:unnamed protein product [Moneuplotes crassus]|uniref:C2 domain-containing protein n=1 Tax=Euplotes crassus TaxID=5936 RepID=A0AAD1UAN2_EUPCR|nr:unnamed protein product [Moneuplotes crassus]
MEYYDPGQGITSGQNDASGPKVKLQLFISCRKLKDMDYIGKSDPFCEVWLKNDERSDWTMVDKTDTMINDLNPDFTKPIIIDYYFEKNQEIRFEVYDQDQGGKEKQGKHSTKVANLLGAYHQTYVGSLGKKDKGSKIIIKSESIKESNQAIVMSVSCEGLKSKKKNFGLSSTNHPYLMIKRCQGYETSDDDFETALTVYSSHTLHDTLSPAWNIGEFPVQYLCNSDLDIPLIFEVWSFQESKDDRIYGRVRGTARHFIETEGEAHSIIKKQGNPYGTMTFDKFQLIQRPTMVDYLRSGWIISLSVAIDFTASNGELSEPTSLHYIDPYNPTKMSAYESAIYQIGSILEGYDSDRQFPVFGFGAKPRFCGIDEVSHCFHLNGSENPQVEGVQGILEAYRYALANGLGLYGPTNFEPCLSTMMEFISGRKHLAEYNIMLYITDGAITDLEETISAIIEASHLPMSIIIVGVGNADFGKMDFLDNDGSLLKDKLGKVAQRDIVQFVEYKNYATDISLLSEDVLREVPKQFVSYMSCNGIQPNPNPHDAPF